MHQLYAIALFEAHLLDADRRARARTAPMRARRERRLRRRAGR